MTTHAEREAIAHRERAAHIAATSPVAPEVDATETVVSADPTVPEVAVPEATSGS